MPSTFPGRLCRPTAGIQVFAHKPESQYRKLLRFYLSFSLYYRWSSPSDFFVSDMMDDDLGRKGLWCGFISQFILAVVIYSEINRQKKGQDKQSKDK